MIPVRLIVLILIICLSLEFLLSSGDIRVAKIGSFQSWFSGIYVGSVVVSPYNLTRIKKSLASWESDLFYYSPSSILKVVSRKPIDPFDTLLFSPKHGLWIHQLVYAYKSLLEDFVKTSLPWLLRTTDDVFIYMPNLVKLINILDMKYNPYDDAVLKGHLCSYYLHGGSGWLVSRKAAMIILSEFQKHPPKNNQEGDDVFFPQYFRKLNISKEKWNSRAFLGSPFSLETQERFLHDNFKQLQKCTEQPMVRMKDIAVWHCGSNLILPIAHGKHYMEVMPDNIYGFPNLLGFLDLCEDWNGFQPLSFNEAI